MKQSIIFKDAAQETRLRAEAEFGMRETQKYLNELSNPASVLEVGCGTGLLLTMLAERYSDVSFTGVEPIGPGFSQFAETLNAVERKHHNLTFARQRIEEVQTSQKYDLIYSINVFEHLDDWRLAIDKCVSMLKSDGQLVILCPNYWFPYESHFALPIILNKPLTYSLFSKKIQQIENRMDAHGLWESLNFIKTPQVKKHCKRRGYNFIVDKQMMKRMLDRLSEDPEFRQRQSGLARLASFANKLGAGFLLSILPARLSAYLKIVIW